MIEKKLENFFASIDYSFPSDNKIEITITDDKIKNIKLDSFHIVSSKSVLYIYLNDSYPIFKYQIESKIKMKEYHYNANNTCLLISIIGYQLKESIISFKQRKVYQYLFKRVLDSIYLKYKYKNSILLYYGSLKKKTIDSFKSFYFYQLKNKISMIKLGKYRKALYSKEYLFKCQMKLFKKVYLNQKRILLIYRTFFGKVAIRKVSNEETGLKKAKAISYLMTHLKSKALKGFLFQKQLIIMLNSLGCEFNLQKSKWKALNVLLKYHLYIKKQNERIRKYNRMNYTFLDIISNKYIKGSYSLAIRTNKELLLAFIALLKNNKLKVLYTATKLARLAIVKREYLKILKHRQLKAQKQFKMNKKQKEIKNVYLIFANWLFNSKISLNKIMIMDCIHKQRTFQSFFINIAIALENKLKYIELDKTWKIYQTKYRLYEFLSSLFLSKTLNETKVICKKVTSSFEIVSLRLLTKRRQKMIQILLEQNIFNRFKQGVRMIKYKRIIKYKQNYIVKKQKKAVFIQFISSQRKEALLTKKERKMRMNSIKKVYYIYQKRIQLNKWTNAAMISRQEKLQHNSLIVLYHYSRFKLEMRFRDNYFNNNLNKIVKDHLFNKFFIKSAVLLKCSIVTKIIQDTNNKKRALLLIRKQIAQTNVKEIIHYSHQIKYIQIMIQVAYFKSDLKEKTKYIRKKTFNNQMIKFHRILIMRKKIQRHFYAKIMKFNIKKTLQKISSVIKWRYINEYLYTKFHYKTFINSIHRKKKFHESIHSKQCSLFTRIPFIYFKSIIKENKRVNTISSKYYSYIIRKIILKPVKIKKLLLSLSPVIRVNKIIGLFFFLRQIKYIYLAKRVCEKRRSIVIKSFIQNQIFNSKYCRTINKLIRLFTIKHNLKHFMIIVLDRIRNELILSKQRGLLLKKSYKKLKKTDNIKDRMKDKLTKSIKSLQNTKQKNGLCLFFALSKQKKHITDIKLQTLMILKQKELKEYVSFFKTINKLFQSKKKTGLIHQRYRKNFKKGFIDCIKKKLLFLKQSSFLLFKNICRNFLLYSIKSLNNRSLEVSKRKFVYMKYLKQLYTLVQKQISSKTISLCKAEIFKIMRKKHLKRYFQKLIKEALFLRKEKRILKRKLFEMLKQNCLISHDINHYLNQAEELMT